MYFPCLLFLLIFGSFCLLLYPFLILFFLVAFLSWFRVGVLFLRVLSCCPFVWPSEGRCDELGFYCFTSIGTEGAVREGREGGEGGGRAAAAVVAAAAAAAVRSAAT